jgi:hypothetical protein
MPGLAVELVAFRGGELRRPGVPTASGPAGSASAGAGRAFFHSGWLAA